MFSNLGRYNKFVVLFLMIGFILRFYKLGMIPFGLYQDETAIGYNAYSILKTGRDEYGVKFPIYFKSFGDYKLPVYIYLTSLSIAIFGMTEFAVRFPSALFGFLTLPLVYLLVKKFTGRAHLALLTLGLLAINPWHLHYSRATFEVSVGLFLLVAGWLCLVFYFSKKKIRFIVGASVVFALATYTYNLTRILAPSLYLGLFLVHWNSNRLHNKLRNKGLWLGLMIFLLLMLPMVLTMAKPGGAGSATGTLIYSSATIQAQIIEFRGYLVDSPILIRKFIFNRLTLTGWRYLMNIANYFSVNFFFLTGSSHGNHGLGDVGQFYLFELPLIIWGAVLIYSKGGSFYRGLWYWFFLTIGVAALTRESPHATRSFFLILPMVVFSATGLEALWMWFSRQKQIWLRAITAGGFGALVIFGMVYYFTDYYLIFPDKYAKSWKSAEKELAFYLRNEGGKYQKIIIDKDAGIKYTSLLFYQKYSPLDFQGMVVRTADDSEGFNEVTRFGKYEFRGVDWEHDLKEDRNLIITLAGKEEGKGKAIQSFYYPTRPVAYSVKQEIYQLPIQDIAFVAVVKKENWP